MNTVRAKFRCSHLEVYESNRYKVNLSAVSNNSKENSSFNKYTPSGTLSMTIDNPEAALTFIPGKEYYLDFTEAN